MRSASAARAIRSRALDRAGDRAAVERRRHRLRLHRLDRARRRTPSASPARRVRRRRRRRLRPGRRSRSAATPARRRSPRARAMPTPTGRPTRRRGGRRCRSRTPSSRSALRVGTLPAAAFDRDHARLGHQSRRTCPTARARPSPRWSRRCRLRSQWSRHEFGADLRGSFTDYDQLPSSNRPLVDAKTFTRIDVSRDTHVDTESRFLLSTDYPGSPNLPADIAKLPIFTSYGTTAGLTQRFNRLELSGKASVDRTAYQDSMLTDGTTSSNHDRDYNQYGGQVRASYEVMAGRQAVRRARRRHPPARPAIRPQWLPARLARAHAQGRHHVRAQPQAHRRGLGRLSDAPLPGPVAAGVARRGGRRLAGLGGHRPDHRDAHRQFARRGDGRRRRLRRAAARRCACRSTTRSAAG